MVTLDSIQAKIAKLQAQAEALVVNKSTVVLNKIRDLMDKHGISVADVDAHVGKRRGRKAAGATGTASAKYRDPKSGATWTGHGRAPQWIADAKDRSKFLVEGAAQAAAPAKTEAKRAGNYKRGPQPALYRDPKSGATWSGRGRAPAWIANAKDRSRFLIADADSKTVEAPVAKKAASARKATPAKQATAAKKAAPAKKTAAAKKAPTKKTIKLRKAEPVKAVSTAKESTTTKKATVTKKATPAKKATTARKAPTKKAAAVNPQVQDAATAPSPSENTVPAADLSTATA